MEDLVQVVQVVVRGPDQEVLLEVSVPAVHDPGLEAQQGAWDRDLGQEVQLEAEDRGPDLDQEVQLETEDHGPDLDQEVQLEAEDHGPDLDQEVQLEAEDHGPDHDRGVQ